MNAFAETLPPAALLTFVAVLGLIFGSFVTALSYRLPRGISVAKGRSACPACGTILAPRDLIPVFSWLINRRTCRACGVPVSWRYPAVEVTMAALFVAAVLLVDDVGRACVVLLATPAMVALAVIDIEHRRLPNILVLYLASTALLFRHVVDGDFVLAIGSAMGIFAFAIAVDQIGRRFLNQGLGMGDAKLMAVVALALPPMGLFAALGAAGCLGVVTGLLMAERHTAGRTQVPFGPAILVGLWGGFVAL